MQFFDDVVSHNTEVQSSGCETIFNENNGKIIQAFRKRCKKGRKWKAEKGLKGEVGNLCLLQGVTELCDPLIELNIRVF